MVYPACRGIFPEPAGNRIQLDYLLRWGTLSVVVDFWAGSDLYSRPKRIPRGSIMAVHSSNFDVTELTGEDALRFHQQIAEGRSNKAAIEGLEEGSKLLQDIKTKGYALVTPKSSR